MCTCITSCTPPSDVWMPSSPRACAAADTRKKFYMEDASHTYRKYKDIRDKCVFYNKHWERSALMCG